jgi:tetratricopeptide (TPR) repeat protein
LLFAVAFLVYANTFGNGWTYDDFPVIVENLDVRSWTAFLKDSYPGRPLRELTYLFDHSLFGLKPFGWHVQQIFWHGLNACLVFALGRRLQLARWAALLASLIFLLHPLQVEVVANISHRKDSLALAGSLGAILCYLRFLPEKRQRVSWLLASIGCFVLALSAKQTALMVPLVCVVYEVLLLPKEQRLLARFPLLLAGLAVVGISLAFWWWNSVDGWQTLLLSMQDTISFKANYFEPVTLVVYYLTILKSWLFMGLKLVWPFELAPEYTFPVVSQLFDPWAIGAFVFLIVLAWALCWAARRRPVACWLTVTAICFFLPTSNLWPLTYLAADRYLYAPIAFLALLVGSALTRVHAPGKWVFVPALLILSLFAGLTWQQNQVWYSPKTLWTQAIKVSPESSFALNNMGNLSLLDGNLAEAAQYYQRSAEVNPLNPTAHYNLGMLAERRRDMQTAIIHYRAFARLNHPVYREQLEALRTYLLRNYGIKL